LRSRSKARGLGWPEELLSSLQALRDSHRLIPSWTHDVQSASTIYLWEEFMLQFAASFVSPNVHLPGDLRSNIEIILRWIHFLAGITWIGLLYFFNLVNVPFQKELDAATKGKVVPALMPRALWWFRMAAVLTVLVGLAYWGSFIVGVDARNAGASSGTVMLSFFGIWTVVWGILYAALIPGKGLLDKGAVIGVIYAVVVTAAAWLFLSINDQGWQSNRLLSIGIGGGMGWVMMLNVWGIIWRIQKRLIAWTKDNAQNGTPIPEQSKRMARMGFLASRANAFLSLPMLFFMGTASHYPLFGK
jgi:uncharacterized membrane protein